MARGNLPTTRLSTGVMHIARVCVRSVIKSVSRLDTRPTSFDPILPSTVIGTPLILRTSRRSSSSLMLFCGESTAGSTMKPFSYILTLRIMATCSSIVQLQ